MKTNTYTRLTDIPTLSNGEGLSAADAATSLDGAAYTITHEPDEELDPDNDEAAAGGKKKALKQKKKARKGKRGGKRKSKKAEEWDSDNNDDKEDKDNDVAVGEKRKRRGPQKGKAKNGNNKGKNGGEVEQDESEDQDSEEESDGGWGPPDRHGYMKRPHRPQPPNPFGPKKKFVPAPIYDYMLIPEERRRRKAEAKARKAAAEAESSKGLVTSTTPPGSPSGPLVHLSSLTMDRRPSLSVTPLPTIVTPGGTLTSTTPGSLPVLTVPKTPSRPSSPRSYPVDTSSSPSEIPSRPVFNASTGSPVEERPRVEIPLPGGDKPSRNQPSPPPSPPPSPGHETSRPYTVSTKQVLPANAPNWIHLVHSQWVAKDLGPSWVDAIQKTVLVESRANFRDSKKPFPSKNRPSEVNAWIKHGRKTEPTKMSATNGKNLGDR